MAILALRSNRYGRRTLNPEVAGSNPARVTMALKAKRPSHQPFKLATSGFKSRQRHYGRVAQTEERRLDTPKAAGSTPVATTGWGFLSLVDIDV